MRNCAEAGLKPRASEPSQTLLGNPYRFLAAFRVSITRGLQPGSGRLVTDLDLDLRWTDPQQPSEGAARTQALPIAKFTTHLLASKLCCYVSHQCSCHRYVFKPT